MHIILNEDLLSLDPIRIVHCGHVQPKAVLVRNLLCLNDDTDVKLAAKTQQYWIAGGIGMVLLHVLESFGVWPLPAKPFDEQRISPLLH